MNIKLQTGEVEHSEDTPEWYSAEVILSEDGDPTVIFTTPGYETEDEIVVEGGFACYLKDLPALHLQALAELDALKVQIEEYEEYEYEYEDEDEDEDEDEGDENE